MDLNLDKYINAGLLFGILDNYDFGTENGSWIHLLLLIGSM